MELSLLFANDGVFLFSVFHASIFALSSLAKKYSTSVIYTYMDKRKKLFKFYEHFANFTNVTRKRNYKSHNTETDLEVTYPLTMGGD